MSVDTLDPEHSLGIFELDENGTVVYSNFEGSTGWANAEKDIKGRDFFNEVLGFTNVADLQRRLEVFKADSLLAQSFDFVCHYHNQSVPVKVLLAQLCDRSEVRRKTILVHLRRGSQENKQQKSEVRSQRSEVGSSEFKL
jgi:hypothetical protein